MEGTLTMTLLCCFRSHLGFSFTGLTPKYVDVSVTRRLSYHATAIISRALVVLKSVVPRPLTSMDNRGVCWILLFRMSIYLLP
ncbi:hypothetical protein T11_17628 [Trichinella zimbabwensis]|uniref:Secreted protein n=1 Tax=Trichinella zimbabwensis TaxID=268475 RepID=A0A0V1H704_9BILA|nr:hypothetical protein T11_17628 [Trichinella zimbabwensis]